MDVKKYQDNNTVVKSIYLDKEPSKIKLSIV